MTVSGPAVGDSARRFSANDLMPQKRVSRAFGGPLTEIAFIDPLALKFNVGLIENHHAIVGAGLQNQFGGV